MADGGTISNRIGDLIGSTFNADVGYAGDLINAAINEIATKEKSPTFRAKRSSIKDASGHKVSYIFIF